MTPPPDPPPGSPEAPAEFLALVEEALDLIEAELPGRSAAAIGGEPLPSLYEQCLEAAREIAARPAEPVRLLHHFACTGGTLISRYLAATPNARLISEIDPLSPIPRPHFSPTDLILQYRTSTRPAEDAVAAEIFLAGIEVLQRSSTRRGERLILRDHSHSHFCTGASIPKRPGLYGMVSERFAVRAVVTVRHPLDSYLALRSNGWLHFEPGTLTEYARRYAAFLEAHAGLQVVRYEEFVETPEAALERLCAALELAPVAETMPDLLDIATAVSLTGDSGRGGTRLGLRPRREIPGEVETERGAAAYRELCDRLGYPP